MSFGLLSTGFSRKRLPDIRAAIVDAWRQAYGENAKTDSDSADGHQIDILATQLAEAWEALEDAYLAYYVSTATGSALDLAVEWLGLTRLAAEASTVGVVLFGDDATVVPVSSLMETGDNEDQFSLDAEVTIGDTTDVYVVEIAGVVDGELHRITIDGADFDYTAGALDTDEDVRDALIASVGASYTASDGGRIPDGGAILVIQGVSGLAVSVTGDTPANTVLYFAELGAASSIEEDAISANATSLDTVVSSVTGWDGVTNLLDAVVGRAVESDADLRERARELLQARGTATPDAIADRLVLEVEGVEAARVFENTSDTTDGAGRPPHSFEAVVLGGTDADVAQKIWDLKAAGIETFGSVSETATDTNGTDRTVNFSRATELYAHLEITITKGEGFPDVDETELAAQVASDVAAYGDANLSLGDDLYRLALHPTIIASIGAGVTAASAIDIETGTTALPTDPTPPLSPADLAADGTEIVRLDTSRISVIFA